MMLAVNLLTVHTACGDWREEVVGLALAGDAAGAVEHAERARTPWFAPRLARALAPPEHFVGWVLAREHIVAYTLRPQPEVFVRPRPHWFTDAVTAVRGALERAEEPPPVALAALRAELVEPLAPLLSRSPRWVFATDGLISDVSFPLLTEHVIVHALSERSAALAAQRVDAARRRPPVLFAYARAHSGDPDALPAARAEIELAAAALGAPATLLSGADALARLRVAVYDGRLTQARYVLIAAHAGEHAGVISLDLAPGDDARFVPHDMLHLQLGAELVVLSACETAGGADGDGSNVHRFPQAAVFTGVGLTLLTQWRVDDAASAQFVAALFEHLGRGARVDQALPSVQRAFAAGEHGEAYAHPFFWAGWQLWGG